MLGTSRSMFGSIDNTRFYEVFGVKETHFKKYTHRVDNEKLFQFFLKKTPMSTIHKQRKDIVEKKKHRAVLKVNLHWKRKTSHETHNEKKTGDSSRLLMYVLFSLFVSFMLCCLEMEEAKHYIVGRIFGGKRLGCWRGIGWRNSTRRVVNKSCELKTYTNSNHHRYFLFEVFWGRIP